LWDYSEKLLDHFYNPRNMGEVEEPDSVVQVGNIACGDALRLSLKIRDGHVVDAKFKTFGCGSAIAAASALTEMVKGKTLEEAIRISNEDIAEYLDGLPAEKMHCSVMGQEALQKAIALYRGEKISMEEDYLCECFQVTEEKIRSAILNQKLTTLEQVTHYTKAGGGCGRCHDRILELLSNKSMSAPASVAPDVPRSPMTNLERIRLIQATFERDVAPFLATHGGSAELVDVEGTKVYVRLAGACKGCPHHTTTISDLIQMKLREHVDPHIEVKEED